MACIVGSFSRSLVTVTINTDPRCLQIMRERNRGRERERERER